MRQIVIDTETTGLEIEHGHRIVEIGCVELINRRITNNRFHYYINPQRAVDTEALLVHGITDNFLADRPVFGEILEELLQFIQGAELIAHNASFDVGFINHEIRLSSRSMKPLEQYLTITDTLALARKKFPGQRNTLDALCKRYGIGTEERKAKGHGALLDAELLAKVYLLMTGGQSNLFSTFDFETNVPKTTVDSNFHTRSHRETTKIIMASSEELSEHSNFLTAITKKSGRCIWNN
jgi:DNA polymerase-3 subunit epsilon